MRVTLTSDEVVHIMMILKEGNEDDKELASKLHQQLIKPITNKKKNATIKATETRKRAAQEKIIKTVAIMKSEGKNITSYQIAKRAKISFNTVKKYQYLFENDITK